MKAAQAKRKQLASKPSETGKEPVASKLSQMKPLPDGRTAAVLALPSKGDGNSAFRSVGGSEHEILNRRIMGHLMRATWAGEVPKEDPDGLALWECLIPSVAAVQEFEPKDTQEALLIAQMVATYNAAMECFRRAMLKEQTFEGRQSSLSQANKLVRSYATLLQTLDKHRGKGQQKVTVEHVHVYQGGQAVVGNVEAGGGRPALPSVHDSAMPMIEGVAAQAGGVLVETGE